MAASTATGYLSFDRIGMVFPDGTEAVGEVSFTVAKGEFVTVVGPSGCGKSTLLKIASGLLEPTPRIGRRRSRPARLRVPGSRRCCRGEPCSRTSSCCPSCTASPRPSAASWPSGRSTRWASRGSRRHYPKALSGGMRMRCSLARTLTLSPPLFLFDEPFGAVDEITREHLNEETQRLFASEGFAGLFITHSISEAVFLSTRVLVMSARPGRIVAEFAVPFGVPASSRSALRTRVRQAQRRGLPRPARCPHMSEHDWANRRCAHERGREGSPDSDADLRVPSSSSRRSGIGGGTSMAVALPPILLGLLIVGVWYFISYVMLEERRRFLLRPPHQVIEVGFLDWDNFRDDPRVALDRAPRWR